MCLRSLCGAWARWVALLGGLCRRRRRLSCEFLNSNARGSHAGCGKSHAGLRHSVILAPHRACFSLVHVCTNLTLQLQTKKECNALDSCCFGSNADLARLSALGSIGTLEGRDERDARRVATTATATTTATIATKARATKTAAKTMTTARRAGSLLLLSALLLLVGCRAAASDGDRQRDALRRVLEGALEVSRLESRHLRRDLLQSFGAEVASGGYGEDAGALSPFPGDSILDLMKMGEMMMPNAGGGATSPPSGPAAFPALDADLMKTLFSESSALAKEACDPLVVNSMGGGLAAMMFPPEAKDMYRAFCGMVPRGDGPAPAAPAMPFFKNLGSLGNLGNLGNLGGLGGLGGMLGPQILPPAPEETTGGARSSGSDLVASILGLGSTSTARVSPPTPATISEAKVVLPSNQSSVESNTTRGEDEAEMVRAADFAEEAKEEMVGMDYIDGPVPPMPDISQLFSGYGELFALEQQLPDMLDHLIDEAWDELGTEDQAYAAKHKAVPPPLPAAYVDVQPVFIEGSGPPPR